MVRRIHIRNFLLIDEAEIDLGPGFTVITGETGSGKSILLGALGLAMGERADGVEFHDPSRRCVIEVEMDAPGMHAWFEQNELPWQEPVILRRQLEPGGRSRAFINDTPVRLDQLRALTAQCIHIHGQHHVQLLTDPRLHLGAIDRVAALEADTQHYGGLYRHWRSVRAELERLREEEARLRQELEFMRFQLDELVTAALRPSELEELTQRLEQATHAGEIRAALLAVEQGIHDDMGVLPVLTRLSAGMDRAARHDPRIRALTDRLNSVRIELKDVADEAASLAGDLDDDPIAMERMSERLDLLNALLQKHRVRTVEELIALQDDLRQRVDRATGMGDRMAELAREEEQLAKQVNDQARKLSKARQKSAPRLAGAVEQILHELGMPHAVFQLQLRDLAEPGPYGMDGVQALFSADADRTPGPLEKTASGGEMSRVMLALISQAAHATGLATLVFDEVDTGVSGAVAERMGALMARMGGTRQVIAITHLPQVAAQALAHLEVVKSTTGERTTTRIVPLEGEERITAIARMLSGRRLSKVAMDNARALMERS